MQTPTATKVINCLMTDLHLTNEENDVLHYFTMYIQCLDEDKAGKFTIFNYWIFSYARQY